MGTGYTFIKNGREVNEQEVHNLKAGDVVHSYRDGSSYMSFGVIEASEESSIKNIKKKSKKLPKRKIRWQ